MKLPHLMVMDIARPEFKERKRRRQIAMAAVVVVVVAALTVVVYRLRPAAPSVERGTVWTDSVKRGSMLRQVRGIGSLVPSQESVLQIQLHGMGSAWQPGTRCPQHCCAMTSFALLSSST